MPDKHAQAAELPTITAKNKSQSQIAHCEWALIMITDKT